MRDILRRHTTHMNTEQTFEIVNGVYIGPEHWECDLDLRKYMGSLISLGNLKTVGWWLDLSGCSSLTSLGNLKTVGWWLDLKGCTGLTTLGNLEKVEGSLLLEGCSSLTTLGNLEKVDKGISLHGSKEVPLKEVQDKILHYSSLQAHEALNAITSKEVQEVPLYRNILTEILQKV